MVGDNIKRIRMSKGLSLRKLALMADISNGTLSYIENNKTNASIGTLEKLAVAMKCNQSDFFDDNELNEVKEVINTKEEINSFTIKLVNELLKEGIIDNIEVIPDEITKMITAALTADLKRIKAEKRH